MKRQEKVTPNEPVMDNQGRWWIQTDDPLRSKSGSNGAYEVAKIIIGPEGELEHSRQSLARKIDMLSHEQRRELINTLNSMCTHWGECNNFNG